MRNFYGSDSSKRWLRYDLVASKLTLWVFLLHNKYRYLFAVPTCSALSMLPLRFLLAHGFGIETYFRSKVHLLKWDLLFIVALFHDALWFTIFAEMNLDVCLDGFITKKLLQEGKHLRKQLVFLLFLEVQLHAVRLVYHHIGLFLRGVAAEPHVLCYDARRFETTEGLIMLNHCVLIIENK